MAWSKLSGLTGQGDLSLKAGGILTDALKASSGGKLFDIIPLLKFMYNPNSSTSAEEDVWSAGGTLQRLSSAEKLVITSPDALDIIIRGVDNDYNLITETVTSNGVDPATTVNEFLSVYSSQIDPSSANVNSGVITGVAELALDLQFQIEAGDGQTQMCHFVVPAGYTCFLYSTLSICSRNDDALVSFQISENGGAYITKLPIEVSDATPPLSFCDYPLAISEKSWIRLRAKAETNNTRISSNYRIVLFDNDYLNSIS